MCQDLFEIFLFGCLFHVFFSVNLSRFLRTAPGFGRPAVERPYWRTRQSAKKSKDGRPFRDEGSQQRDFQRRTGTSISKPFHKFSLIGWELLSQFRASESTVDLKSLWSLYMCDRVDQHPIFPYNRGWENQPNSVGVYIPNIRIPSLKVGGLPSPI